VPKRKHVFEVQQQPEFKTRYAWHRKKFNRFPLIVSKRRMESPRALEGVKIGAVLVAIEHGINAFEPLGLVEFLKSEIDDLSWLGAQLTRHYRNVGGWNSVRLPYGVEIERLCLRALAYD
jgi:hypothetical protein